MKNIMEFKYGDIVKHKPTKDIWKIGNSISGTTYSDGEKNWCNVESISSNPKRITALPEDELILIIR